MAENLEKVHRINEVLDEITENAFDLTKDLISSLGEFKYSALFWVLLSFLFLVGSIQGHPSYPQSDLGFMLLNTVVILAPAVYGASRIWRYYSLKKKYSKLYTILEELKKL